MLLYALCLLHLSVGSLAMTSLDKRAGQGLDNNSGNCIQPAQTQKGTKRYCNINGVLKHPSPQFDQYVTYDAQECATRCYTQNSNCESFSFDSAAVDGDANCKTYGSKLRKMGLTKASNSTVTYFAFYCWSLNTVPAKPVKDGNFTGQGSSDYWNPGSSIANGQDNNPPRTSSSSEAAIDGFSNYVNPHSGYPGSRNTAGNFIEQTVQTCPGSTYSFTFSGDTVADDYQAPFNLIFLAAINDQTVDTEDDTSPEHEIGPVYFTTSDYSVTLTFAVPLPPEEIPGSTPSGPYHNEQLVEQLSNVVFQNVWRGSLPSGTMVYNV